MSHELRTPMNAILGFTEMLLDGLYGEVPAELKEPLDRHPGERPPPAAPDQRRARPVQDRGRAHGSSRWANIRCARSSTSSTSRCGRWPPRRGSSSRSACPTICPVAYGDSGRLTQCLMNLAGNAIKFTRQGRVEIGGRAGRETSSSIRVSDTGIGIPKEELDNVFAEFRQVDADGHPRVRRHGARPQHHQEVRGDARRPHLGRERDRQGLHVLLRRPVAGEG